jgi:tRNA(Arg) A34 adenosine deaminase TadA
MVNKWMDESLDLATEALEAGEVSVGCVCVKNDEAIAEGHNTANETHHTTFYCILFIHLRIFLIVITNFNVF